MTWKSQFFPDCGKPRIIAIAGSNGAGKSTFFEIHFADLTLPFINADVLAREFEMDAYQAAALAESARTAHVKRRESFIFETVFSDPVGAKLDFLNKAGEEMGYEVTLIFIRVNSIDQSKSRVSARVIKGGHDVPDEKLEQRFDRTLKNLNRAISVLPLVLVFDNSSSANPYQLEDIFENGQSIMK